MINGKNSRDDTIDVRFDDGLTWDCADVWGNRSRNTIWVCFLMARNNTKSDHTEWKLECKLKLPQSLLGRLFCIVNVLDFIIELNFVVWVYFMLGISCSRIFVVVLADRTERTEWMRHHHLTCLYIAPRLGQVLFETVWDCCMSKVWWQTSHRRSLFQQRHMYTLYVNVCGLMCKCIYGMDVMSLERSERSRPVRGILSFSAKVYGKHTINVFTCKKKNNTNIFEYFSWLWFWYIWNGYEKCWTASEKDPHIARGSLRTLI